MLYQTGTYYTNTMLQSKGCGITKHASIQCYTVLYYVGAYCTVLCSYCDTSVVI